MLPDNTLSAEPVPGQFLGARASVFPDKIDYIEGPIQLSNANEGLEYQIWTAEALADFVEDSIYLSAPNTPPIRIYTGNGITEVSLAFDHAGAAVVAFIEAGVAKLLWYDSVVNDYVVSIINGNVTNVRVALDDLRRSQAKNSDVILAYLKNGQLHYRQQRDRYEVEMLLDSRVWNALIRIGRGDNLRFQFQVV